MSKKIYFIEPIDRGLVSFKIRAEKIVEADPTKTLKLIKIENRANSIAYIFELFAKLSEIKKEIVIFTKPNLISAIILAKIFKIKVIVDINDPLHLKNYLGKFSKYKFITILKLADKVIFESAIYRNKWNLDDKKTIIIEDVPIKNKNPISFESREELMIWVGSPKTSFILNEYEKLFKKLHELKIKTVLLGADINIEKKLSKYCNNIKNYNEDDMQYWLSKAKYSIVPMKDEDLYNLRGNLKQKICLSMGTVTFASNIEMHRNNLYRSCILFDDQAEIISFLISLKINKNNIETRINLTVENLNNLTQAKQAEMVINFAKN